MIKIVFEDNKDTPSSTLLKSLPIGADIEFSDGNSRRIVMALVVYRRKKDIPEDIFVLSNDAYFFNNTFLYDDEFTRMVLKEVEEGRYKSDLYFIPRTNDEGDDSGISKDELSTGAKTILNIYYHPDKCFNGVECGINVKELFRFIKNGKVYWQYPAGSIIEEEDNHCDIVMEGVHYTSYEEFIDYCSKYSVDDLDYLEEHPEAKEWW